MLATKNAEPLVANLLLNLGLHCRGASPTFRLLEDRTPRVFVDWRWWSFLRFRRFGQATFFRYLDLALASEELSRNAFLLFRDDIHRSFRHDVTATHARARTEVDDVIGGTHRIFVMLDDDDRVTKVTQLLERFQQTIVVTRVETNRGLVENVEHANQATADLACEPDALRFSTGKRGSRPIEREIVESDVQQKAQTAADLTQNFRGNDRTCIVEH